VIQNPFALFLAGRSPILIRFCAARKLIPRIEATFADVNRLESIGRGVAPSALISTSLQRIRRP
jgi:hypothetical protein